MTTRSNSPRFLNTEEEFLRRILVELERFAVLAGGLATTPIDAIDVTYDDLTSMYGGTNVQAVLDLIKPVQDQLLSDVNYLLNGSVRRRKVIAIVDNTAVPPTEVDGDRYILDFTGASNVAWDGAAAGDIVQYNGTSGLWEAETPEEGWVAYVDDQNADALFTNDGTPAWDLRVASSSKTYIAATQILANALTGLNEGDSILIQDNGSGEWVLEVVTAITTGAYTTSTLLEVASEAMLNLLSDLDFDYAKTIWVRSNGDDLKDGLNPKDAVATIIQAHTLATALSPTATGRVKIEILDSAEYTIDDYLEIDQYIDIYGPNATIKIIDTGGTTGELLLNGNNALTLHKLYDDGVTFAGIYLNDPGIDSTVHIKIDEHISSAGNLLTGDNSTDTSIVYYNAKYAFGEGDFLFQGLTGWTYYLDGDKAEIYLDGDDATVVDASSGTIYSNIKEIFGTSISGGVSTAFSCGLNGRLYVNNQYSDTDILFGDNPSSYTNLQLGAYTGTLTTPSGAFNLNTTEQGVHIPQLTAQTGFDASNDLVKMWDASAGEHVSTTLNGLAGVFNPALVRTIYFGKHGNDTTGTGTSINNAVLTLTKAANLATALVPAAGNEVAIICMDTGTITDKNIVIPDYCHLFAPNLDVNVTSSTGEIFIQPSGVSTIHIRSLTLSGDINGFSRVDDNIPGNIRVDLLIHNSTGYAFCAGAVTVNSFMNIELGGVGISGTGTLLCGSGPNKSVFTGTFGNLNLGPNSSFMIDDKGTTVDINLVGTRIGSQGMTSTATGVKLNNADSEVNIMTTDTEFDSGSLYDVSLGDLRWFTLHGQGTGTTTGGTVAYKKIEDITTPLVTKAGIVASGSFALSGGVYKATVTFSGAFADALYAPTITGDDARTWTVESRAVGSFVINSNSAVAPAGNTYWNAIKSGESA